jgi:histidinol-phosphate/aromatic aminotransferase/cobyric acid decarboxylase-like protein
LRGGFIATHPSPLEQYLEPWSINSILARVLEIIAHGDLASFRATTQENLQTEKQFLEENLDREIMELFPQKLIFILYDCAEARSSFLLF